MALKSENILVEGRVIRVENIQLAMSALILNTELMHNPHKFSNHSVPVKYNVISIDCWLNVFHCNRSRKETRVITVLKELQNMGIIDLSKLQAQ